MRATRAETRRRPGGWIKSAIRALLTRASAPLSGHDIARELRRDNGIIHYSAVFRTLTQLLADGTARRIELAPGYVLRRHGAALVLLCSQCGHFEEIADAAPLAELESLACSHRFTPARYIVEVSGSCAACGAPTAPDASRSA